MLKRCMDRCQVIPCFNMMQSMQSMQGGGGIPEDKSSEDKSSDDKSSEDKGLSKEEKRKKLKQKLKEKEEKRTKK